MRVNVTVERGVSSILTAKHSKLNNLMCADFVTDDQRAGGPPECAS